MSKKPIALIIMDGFGYNHKDYGNAIRAAKTPNIDRLLANYPHTRRMTAHFTCSDFFQTAAFTHIIHTSMVFWSLLRKQVLQRFTFIASWTAEMFLLQAELTS